VRIVDVVDFVFSAESSTMTSSNFLEPKEELPRLLPPLRNQPQEQSDFEYLIGYCLVTKTNMQTFFHSWQTILFLTQSNQRVLSLRLANDVSDDAASTILRLAMLVAAKQTHRRAKFVFVSVRCANENVDEPTAWSWSLFKQRVIVLPSQSTRRFLVMSTQLFELMRLLIALDGENNNRIFDVRQTEQREALVFDVPFFFLKKKKKTALVGEAERVFSKDCRRNRRAVALKVLRNRCL
jgi:hypothetical protein